MMTSGLLLCTMALCQVALLLSRQRLLILKKVFSFPQKLLHSPCQPLWLLDLAAGPSAAVEAAVDPDVPKGGNAGWKEVLCTWVVATAPCLAGNLDIVTPILTEFFLMMYATINLACFLNAVLKQPGFR